MKKGLLTALSMLVFACASSPSVDLKKISIGDEKGTVLYKLGNPDRTYSKEGTLRWVYKIHQAHAPAIEKEVWFQEGHVVFIDQTSKNKKDPIPYEPVN